MLIYIHLWIAVIPRPTISGTGSDNNTTERYSSYTDEEEDVHYGIVYVIQI